MARRGRDNPAESEPVSSQEEAAPADLSEEDTVSETATEEVEETALPGVTEPTTETEAEAEPEPEPEPAPEKEKAVIDLTPFSEAVATSVTERDSSTGDLPEVAIAPVVTAYRALDGIAAKNKAKAFLTDAMRDAMNSMDIQLARSYMVLQDNLSAGAPAAATPRQPADPTAAYVERKVGLQLALALVVVPERVSADAEDKVTAAYSEQFAVAQGLLAWAQSTAEDKGDEPEAPAYVKAAVKLAQGKAAKVSKSGLSGPRVGSGERKNIGDHIRQAFSDQESGTFLTVAEIRKFESTEYASDNPPSAGAISARLFPTSGKCTLDFVTPGTNDKGNRGATKI